MAPKRAAPVVASEPAAEKEVQKPAAAENNPEEPKNKVLVKNLSHPPTLTMVVEVLKKNKERKGTSVQAIRTQILATHPTVDPLRLKALLRSALKKGIEKGVIIRPAKSTATGATGRFMLAKPGSKPKQQNDKMSENVDPNEEPKQKMKKPPKKAKAAKQEAPKGEKAEKKVKADGKMEKSEERPKPAANKTKKDPEVKPDKAPAAAKKPKAKAAAAEGGKKAKKESATKEKAKPTKAKKDLEETSTAKSNKVKD